MPAGQYHFDHRGEPWKPRNAKGVRHREHCLHDEPGVTVCTCGGCRCPEDHLGECTTWTDAQ